MKILLCNKYFFRKGGAESLFFGTAELLKEKGHEVHYFSMADKDNYPSDDEEYFVSEVDYDSGGLAEKMRHAAGLLYSLEAREKMRRLAERIKPDVVHLHNIYHQISPSILHPLKELGIPVVMTLHDYKMVCGAYTLLSPRGVCEKCGGGRHYHCLVEKCTKNSFPKSLLNMCEMYVHHRLMGIYDSIGAFISPSRFMTGKLREMGFKREIIYLPNFVEAASFEPRYGWTDPAVVYLGRLSKEKGLATLVDAFKKISGINLTIIGDGPERETLEKRIAEEKIGNVRLAGYRTGEALNDEIGRSMFGVIPSECYENNPMSLIELFALGKPAVGSRIGGIPELIGRGERGLLFEPGDPDDLRAAILRLSADADAVRRMGRNARAFVEEELNSEAHYQQLIRIYEGVSGSGKNSLSPGS